MAPEQGIFDLCTLWHKGICKHDQFRRLHQRLNQGSEAGYTLNSREIKRLNQICTLCKFPLMIRKKACPVCGNTNLTLGITQGQLGRNQVFNYNCEQCARILYSHVRFY